MRSARPLGLLTAALACALLGPAFGPVLDAQSSAPLAAADVEERLGAQLPLELAFRSAESGVVLLGSAFRPERPVLLVLASTHCRMLCPLVLHGLAGGVGQLARPPGESYRVLTISLDPRETAADARAARAMLLKEAGLPAGSEGWQVWTGDEESVRALADGLGFRYRYDPVSDQYAHPAVVFVLTPAGKISRYLYGADFPSPMLEQSLTEARAGKSVSSLEKVLLRCFHYVPALRRYGAAVTTFMRGGATLVLLALGGLMVWLWRRTPRQGGAT